MVWFQQFPGALQIALVAVRTWATADGRQVYNSLRACWNGGHAAAVHQLLIAPH